MMPGANPLEAPTMTPAQQDDASFRAFQEYRWDLDRDFLGGLVLALGGYHALSQTASQADIIMHSRIFYYARIRHVTIPYSPYRAWLRAQFLHSQQQQDPSLLSSSPPPPPPRLWEWDLLQALCNHRDRIAGAGPSDQASVIAAAEREAWVRQLLSDDGPPAAAAAARNGQHDGDDDDIDDSSSPKPAWMAAAPRADLYVDRQRSDGDGGGDEDGGGGGADGQVPYPERFAAIIRAVQTGEPIEGIVEIPDIVARNPSTTPFGKLNRPRKPWEKDESNSEEVDQGTSGLESNLDQSFPDPNEIANGVR